MLGRRFSFFSLTSLEAGPASLPEGLHHREVCSVPRVNAAWPPQGLRASEVAVTPTLREETHVRVGDGARVGDELRRVMELEGAAVV